jgi:hypothetical protein
MKLYKRGKVWWVTHWDGKTQIRRSTGCTDKSRAEVFAMSIMAPLLGAGDDKKIDSIASTIKRSLADDRNNAGATGLLLTDCWDLHPHVNKSGRKLKQSSIDRAAQSWRVFVRFCANRGVTTVAEVTERVAADFLDTQTPRMRVLGYQYCRAMFERIGSQQPFTRKPPAPTPTHREPLTHEQISALLARADSLAAGKGACASAGEFATFTRFFALHGSAHGRRGNDTGGPG